MFCKILQYIYPDYYTFIYLYFQNSLNMKAKNILTLSKCLSHHVRLSFGLDYIPYVHKDWVKK